MKINSFWEVIGHFKPYNSERFEELIQELAQRTLDEIMDFQIEFQHKLKQSYTISLWGRLLRSWADAPMTVLNISGDGLLLKARKFSIE